MIQIIKIERKLLNVKINNYYFTEEIFEYDINVHIKAFSHSFVPRKNLRTFDTLQINLSKDVNELLMEMHKSNRNQIRSAEKQEFEHIVIGNPTDQDLKEFQIFYNRFARDKKTHTCDSFHMKTMKLLREKNRLLLTYLQDKKKNVFCARVYIVDGEFAMNLYSASQFRMVDSPGEKRLMSKANRFLIWRDIIFMKEKGHMLYDMGGLTDDENIRRFKLGFGGEIISVYSGYEASSIIGAFVLKLRNWKMAWATARQIQ